MNRRESRWPERRLRGARGKRRAEGQCRWSDSSTTDRRTGISATPPRSVKACRKLVTLRANRRSPLVGCPGFRVSRKLVYLRFEAASRKGRRSPSFSVSENAIGGQNSRDHQWPKHREILNDSLHISGNGKRSQLSTRSCGEPPWRPLAPELRCGRLSRGRWRHLARAGSCICRHCPPRSCKPGALRERHASTGHPVPKAHNPFGPRGRGAPLWPRNTSSAGWPRFSLPMSQATAG